MSPIITTGDRIVTETVEENHRKKQRIITKKRKQLAIKKTWTELREKGFGIERKPVVLDYEDGRMLYDVMPNRAWKDQRCFIIGGGESLRDFDFSRLKGELVIGVNRAYEKIDCVINYAMDNNLYNWITKGTLGPEAKEKLEDFKGFPVWLDSANYDYPKGIFILNKSNGHKFSYSMNLGIRGGTNSGLGALSLAVCLRANPIYLLGFDMKGKNGKQAWWHEGYPESQHARIYNVFINDFKLVAPELKKKGHQIINLNPESALKCFEFGKFDDIEPIKRPIITSYYTKGTPYEDQVEHLKITIKRFNLENDIVGIPDQGSWHKNTYYKPRFIKEMMQKHPDRSIVFVDADAKICANPVLFNDLDCDFACHFFKGRELLSGTLYFGNTKGGRFLLDKWIEEDILYPTTHMPQQNLRATFNKYKNKINWKALPVEYCLIYDSLSSYKVSPVIKHYQLSRKHKKSKPGRHKYRMRKDIAKIQEFCEGKNICLIGNANSILSKKKRINRFDVICRMNRGSPRGKESYVGSRTDILFLSTGMHGENIQHSFDPQFVVWMTACHRLATPWVLKNAVQNPKRDWQRLYKKLEINPTTGLLALSFILKRMNFKSLTIYGFDFFKTRTWYNTKIDSGQKHSGKKEKVIIMEMIKGRKNVRLL